MCNHHDHDGDHGLDRRGFLKTGAAAGATAGSAETAGGKYAPPAKAALPPSDMKLDLKRTALVVTDPQVDFLSPKGVTWKVVGKSVQEHNTVANIGRLFAAAKKAGLTVAISPHYYYPTDKGTTRRTKAGGSRARSRSSCTRSACSTGPAPIP